MIKPKEYSEKPPITKSQTLELLETVQSYYPRFAVTPQIHKAWYQMLNRYDYDTIVENLNEYVLYNRYAPTVSDLVKKRIDNSVPNVEETAQLLQSYQDAPKANEEVAQQNLAKMRKILGIRRDRA